MFCYSLNICLLHVFATGWFPVPQGSVLRRLNKIQEGRGSFTEIEEGSRRQEKVEEGRLRESYEKHRKTIKKCMEKYRESPLTSKRRTLD